MMATSRQTKALLQPLLKRRSDLAFVSRFLFFTPVGHYLRGAVFLSSRWNNIPRGKCFVHQLCNGWPTVDLHFWYRGTCEFRLEREWEADPQKASQDLCELMEHGLASVEPIVDYAEHSKRPAYLWEDEHPNYALDAALGACTKGDFDIAEAIATASDASQGGMGGNYPISLATDDVRLSEDTSWRLPYLLRKLQTDRSEVIPLLHEWEALTVKNCGLTKYWKPSPFPCEL